MADLGTGPRSVRSDPASRIWPPGGVAQLGERLLCKQEVVGSIPITSTRLAAVMEFPGTPVQGAAGQCCLAS